MNDPRPLRTYAVIGLFDSRGEAFVRALWERLGEAGIPCGAEEYAGARPHLTFSIFTGCPLKRLTADIGRLARRAGPVRIEFDRIDLFRVAELSAFLGIVLSGPLRTLHREIDAITECCADKSVSYYRPDRWVPHCTLSTAIEKRQVAIVRRMNDTLTFPRRFLLSGLGITELDHVRQSWTYERDFPFAG